MLERNKQYAKFAMIIKKIHANMLLVDIIAYVPKCMKFVQEITTNMDKYFDEEVIPMSDKCSSII